MLHKKLKELRKLKGWTQKEAAAKSIVSIKAWGAYEEGRAKPPYEALIRMRDLFGLKTIEAFFE